MLKLGHPLAAAGLELQSSRGLWPGKLLKLKVANLILPEEIPSAGGLGLRLLGLKSGTKSGRPQFVLVRTEYHLHLMRPIRLALDPEESITGLRHLGAYNLLIRQGAEVYGLYGTGWTPHSPRAGYCTNLSLPCVVSAIPEMSETCRWYSIKTLRQYLDVVGGAASTPSRSLEARHTRSANHLGLTHPTALLRALVESVRVRRGEPSAAEASGKA